MEQRLGSTRTPDGLEVAFATAGHGPPLLFVGGWLSHLELSWALPAERQFLEGLAHGRTLLRYDRPGCGLSDREVGEPSLASELDVVEAVLAAAGVDRTDVVASSLGVPLMIEWAARHPETVDRLVLYGGWARGADIGTPEVRDHVVGLVAGSWGLGADVLTDIFAPDASAGTRAALSTYQRAASSPATAAALLALCYQVDVTAALTQVRAPTLVVHREQDRAAPLAQARLIAAEIPDARLEVLPGRSHLPYAGDAARARPHDPDVPRAPRGPRAEAADPDRPAARGRRPGGRGADQPRDRRTARDRGALGRGPPRTHPPAPRRTVARPGRGLVGGHERRRLRGVHAD